MKRVSIYELIEKIENELALLVTSSEERNQLQDFYDSLLEMEAHGVETVVLEA